MLQCSTQFPRWMRRDSGCRLNRQGETASWSCYVHRSVLYLSREVLSAEMQAVELAMLPWHCSVCVI